MSYRDIIRAWKDPNFRNSLNAAQRALIPDNPAGLIELSDDDLKHAAGGASATAHTCSPSPACTCYTNPGELC